MRHSCCFDRPCLQGLPITRQLLPAVPVPPPQHAVHDTAAPENCGVTDIGGTFSLETFKTGGVMRPRGKRLRTYYQN